MDETMGREKKIIAFCCNWCGYAAADLTGIQRLQYPPSVRIIRVMCSGMVHPEFVTEALTHGADGVIIIGCKMGECQYRDGNVKAADRAEMIAELMEDLGYEPERFGLYWMSSVETEAFVTAIEEMQESIDSLDS